MRRRFGYLTLPVRLLILAIAASAVLVVGATVALAIANRTVVPAATESALAALRRFCGCEVSVSGSRYRIFRGLELAEPEIRIGSAAAEAGARKARIRIGIGGLLRMRALLRDGLDARSGDSWEVLNEVIAKGAVPRSIVLEDVTAEYLDPAFPISHARWEAIELRSLPDDDRIEIDGEDADFSPLGFFAEIDYREAVVSGRTTVRGVALAPLGADEGELDLELAATREASGDIDLEGRLFVRDLAVSMPAVAPERIGPVHIDYEFAARLQPDFAMSPRYQSLLPYPVPPTASGLLEFQRGRLVLNGVSFDVLLSLRGLPMPRAIGLEVALAETP
ncbi:MAG: hypothetical protein ACOC2Q_02095, partial [Spirochaetota bacterium]